MTEQAHCSFDSFERWNIGVAYHLERLDASSTAAAID
jgi:hypothetical protein